MHISTKMAKENITEKVNFPEDIDFDINNDKLIVKKDEKKIEKIFNHPNIIVKKEGRLIILEAKNATKREKRMIQTIRAHINNMIKGFNEEFVYKLGIVYLHFPITVEIDKDKKNLMIKNFLGEKKARVAKIIPGAEIEVEKNIIVVKSHNKEVAGQTAANIEKATKIRNRDRRKFQDGIFLIERAGRPI